VSLALWLRVLVCEKERLTRSHRATERRGRPDREDHSGHDYDHDCDHDWERQMAGGGSGGNDYECDYDHDYEGEVG